MAGKNIDFKSAPITAATSAGFITIASTVGWYKGAVVWLSAGGQPGVRCQVTEVTSATVLGMGIRSTDAGTAPNYGRSDISAYNGGVATQLEQLVYNSNDLPLS